MSDALIAARQRAKDAPPSQQAVADLLRRKETAVVHEGMVLQCLGCDDFFDCQIPRSATFVAKVGIEYAREHKRTCLHLLRARFVRGEFPFVAPPLTSTTSQEATHVPA